jgi:hypothetical protein
MGNGLWVLAMGLALVVVMQVVDGSGMGHGWYGGSWFMHLGFIGMCGVWIMGIGRGRIAKGISNAKGISCVNQLHIIKKVNLLKISTSPGL